LTFMNCWTKKTNSILSLKQNFIKILQIIATNLFKSSIKN